MLNRYSIVESLGDRESMERIIVCETVLHYLMNKDNNRYLEVVLQNSSYIMCSNPPHENLQIKCAPVFLAYL